MRCCWRWCWWGKSNWQRRWWRKWPVCVRRSGRCCCCGRCQRWYGGSHWKGPFAENLLQLLAFSSVQRPLSLNCQQFPCPFTLLLNIFSWTDVKLNNWICLVSLAALFTLWATFARPILFSQSLQFFLLCLPFCFRSQPFWWWWFFLLLCYKNLRHQFGRHIC